MKILLPFTPHLSSECLEKLAEKNTENWPTINEKFAEKKSLKVAVQINGKTKVVIEVSSNLDEDNIKKEIKKISKLDKYFMNKKIIRIIYVKNKIINYLLKE